MVLMFPHEDGRLFTEAIEDAIDVLVATIQGTKPGADAAQLRRNIRQAVAEEIL